MTDHTYIGSELDLFAAAQNWKSYWSNQLLPFLSGDVLEVGAGIGSNTKLLHRGQEARWVCLEPDPALCSRLSSELRESAVHRNCEVVCGTLPSMSGQTFDAILYIDVLEHIEHDGEELLLAVANLRPGGRLIVLSPAHQQLYSPFDAAIGHFRRYNKGMLRTISPSPLHTEQIRYLDSVGLLLSAANRLMLRQSMPTAAQIGFWDRWVIPVSRVLDRVLAYSLGKTIIAVWRRPKV